MFTRNNGTMLLLLALILLGSFISLSAQNENLEWTRLDVGANNNLNSIWFAGENAYTVGNGGVLVWSPNQGNNWYHLTVPDNPDLKAGGGKEIPDGDSTKVAGTLAGENGALYQLSHKKGEQPQIQQQQSNYSGTFNDVFYTNVYDGSYYAFLVGGNSQIKWSPDAGQSWYNQAAPFSSDNLKSLWFLNALTGWAVGDWGIIYNTTNGGQQWNYVEGDPSNPNYTGVCFVDPDTGFVCGDQGAIYQTPDGGATWNKQTTGTSNNINDILFTSASTGWAVGNNGTILFTKNAGTNWSSLMSNTSSNLNKITRDTQGNVWAVGDSGVVLTNKKPGNVQTSNKQLNFAVVEGDSDKVKPQTVFVNYQGSTPNQWSITSGSNWYSVIPDHGTGNGYFSVFANPDGLAPGQYTGTITVQDGEPNTLPTIINVIMNVYQQGTTNKPFGSFDSPTLGSTVHGSIPVTGWALDDVGIQSVKIYQESNGKSSFLGEASFIEGARPDIQQQYPNYPNSHKAGWGYLLLTNLLPNGGNGIYSIYPVITDIEGNSVNFMSTTITCDNANAVKPFGAIDTPQQGGTASGSNYQNCGWALTPQPNTIPQNGSTINVFVDGVNIGSPQYNLYRSDIAALFPGYNNNNGAAGYLNLNTTSYSNGVHTIQWTATDNGGNSDGIGSRYFTINNTNEAAPRTDRSSLNYGSGSGGMKRPATINNVSADISPVTQVFQITNGGEGILNWQVTSDKEWLTLEPTSGTGDDWVYATVNPAGLAVGLHEAEITIIEADSASAPEFITVKYMVYDETAAPVGNFDYPDSGRSVSGSINLHGWALDDIGVESVKIYLQNGTDKVYLGDAAFAQGARPDIATFYAYYPNYDRAGWSMSFTTNTLENGEYTFIAEATDFEGNTTELAGKPFIIDNSSAVLPFGALDNPTEGGIASGEGYVVTGWALTPQPNVIPADGSTIRVVIDGDTVGSVTYNQPREDITAQFTGYKNSAAPGGKFVLNTTQLPNGVHTICWVVADDAGNTNERLGARNFMVLNNSSTTDIEHQAALPDKSALLPGYPNPFNATTTISYQLAKSSHVSVYIYDILGRRVTSLLENEYKAAGSYRLLWNGTTTSGSAVASGVYLLVFKSEHLNKTQKLLLLK